MSYNKLVERILNTIPEFKNEYLNNAEKNLIDEHTGVHVVFGILFIPYVVNLLKNEDEAQKLQIVFKSTSFYKDKTYRS